MSDDTKMSGYEIDHLGIQSEGPKENRSISSSVTILRPKSPTKSSVGESSLLTFVENSFKDSFIDNICPWEDMIHAFSAPFLFCSQTGASIPNSNMQMYWCNFCQYKSQEKHEMIKHSMTHRFKCNYCNKESFCRMDIIKHSFQMHPAYKKIRKDLKACVLLGDFLDRDERVMISGSQNLDKELLNRNDRGKNLFESHHSSLDPICLTTTQIPTIQPLVGTDIPVSPVNEDGDITSPSMPVLKLTKGSNAYDNDSTLDDDTVDPDCIPEAKHHKYGRVTRSATRDMLQKKKSKTQNTKGATKGKTKTNLQDEGKPTSHFWCCSYCRCCSASMEEILAHQKKTHKGKPSKCLSVIYSKDGEIVHELSKEQITKIKSLIKSPVPLSATPKSATQTIPDHNKNKAASESISDPKDGEKSASSDKNDKRNKETEKTAVTKPEIRLYFCYHCDFSSCGDEGMKAHMLAKHPNVRMIAFVKMSDSTLDFCLFCPESCCSYTTQRKPELEKHRQEKHQIDPSKAAIEVIENNKKGIKKLEDLIEKGMMPYMPAYMCLYCEAAYSTTSLANLKRHVQESHPDETIIVRDCVAYKHKRPSRIYVCYHTGCLFNYLDYNQYLIHISVHKNSYLYECSSCSPWISLEKHQIDPSKATIKGIEDDKKGIKLIPEIKLEDLMEKRTMPYMPAYMCLYCEAAYSTTSLANMKRHVQESHPDETIIVRDCVAYKRKRPSRIYVCDHKGCLFNDLDYKQYLIHICVHKNSCLYECSSCSS